MTLHFVNSAFVSVPEKLILRGGLMSKTPLCVRYGIFVHPVHGPVMIDAGYAPSLYNHPDPSFLLKAYRSILRPEILPAGDPHLALAQLGYGGQDVKHVVLTHFHMDHVGYLDQFPHATVHVSRAAWAEVQTSSRHHLAHKGIFTECLPADLARQISFIEDHPPANVSVSAASRDVLGDGSLIAVPLPGHATGHYGVFFPQLPRTPFYAVDTAWTQAGLMESRERGAPIRFVADSYADARSTALIVRTFVHTTGCDLILCHDAHSTPYDMGASV